MKSKITSWIQTHQNNLTRLYWVNNLCAKGSMYGLAVCLLNIPAKSLGVILPFGMVQGLALACFILLGAVIGTGTIIEVLLDQIGIKPWPEWETPEEAQE